MLRSANFVRECFEDRKEIIKGCQNIQRMTDVSFVAKRWNILVFAKVFIKLLYDRNIRVLVGLPEFWVEHLSSSQSIQIISHMVLCVVIKDIKQLKACSFGNKDWWKARTMKTEYLSSSKVESAAQLESKAACSVNVSSDIFQPLQERHRCQRPGENHAYEEMEVEFD